METIFIKEKVKNLQMDIEELQDLVADREAEIESHMKQADRDLSKENRKEIHVENIKMTKELSTLRHELDEANSKIELSEEKLAKNEDEKTKLERRLNEMLQKSPEELKEMNLAIFTELELTRKDRQTAEVKLNRLETSIHAQGTELLRLKKERERLLKRLHDAERSSGAATRSAANLESEGSKMMEAVANAEERAEKAEGLMSDLKRKIVIQTEDNRRLESQMDQLKVIQCESDREKLQIEAKLREVEFKHEAVQEIISTTVSL